MCLQELDEMKKRLKEMEEEAAALREMQAKVEKEMGAVQGFFFFFFSFMGLIAFVATIFNLSRLFLHWLITGNLRNIEYIHFVFIGVPCTIVIVQELT